MPKGKNKTISSSPENDTPLQAYNRQRRENTRTKAINAMIEKEQKQKAGLMKTRPDKLINLQPGSASKAVAFAMELAELPICDLEDDKMLGERIFQFFDLCQQRDVRPSMPGLAMAVGIDTLYLWEILRGRKKVNNPGCAKFLKRAAQSIEICMNEWMAEGGNNTASLIFLAKNHLGYRDVQEIAVAKEDPLGDVPEQQQLQEALAEAEIIDTEE